MPHWSGQARGDIYMCRPRLLPRPPLHRPLITHFIILFLLGFLFLFLRLGLGDLHGLKVGALCLLNFNGSDDR